MNAQPHGASHGQPYGQPYGRSNGDLAATVGAKTRHHKAPHHKAPQYLDRSPLHHDVAVGNARESDDMDAATRRRFA